MISPDAVSTPEQLAEALKDLIAITLKSIEKLAGETGLAVNTVRAAARGQNFPQQSTFQALTKACNGDEIAWSRAWHRANDSRLRAERDRAPAAVDLDPPHDAVLERLSELGERLKSIEETLDRIVSAQEQQDAFGPKLEAAREAAYQRLLRTLPIADFTTAKWIPSYDGAGLWETEVPCFKATSVHTALAQVRNLFESGQVAQLQVYLISMQAFPRSGTWKEGQGTSWAYPIKDVEAYFDALRERVRDYLSSLEKFSLSLSNWDSN